MMKGGDQQEPGPGKEPAGAVRCSVSFEAIGRRSRSSGSPNFSTEIRGRRRDFRRIGGWGPEPWPGTLGKIRAVSRKLFLDIGLDPSTRPPVERVDDRRPRWRYPPAPFRRPWPAHHVGRGHGRTSACSAEGRRTWPWALALGVSSRTRRAKAAGPGIRPDVPLEKAVQVLFLDRVLVEAGGRLPASSQVGGDAELPGRGAYHRAVSPKSDIWAGRAWSCIH